MMPERAESLDFLVAKSQFRAYAVFTIKTIMSIMGYIDYVFIGLHEPTVRTVSKAFIFFLQFDELSMIYCCCFGFLTLWNKDDTALLPYLTYGTVHLLIIVFANFPLLFIRDSRVYEFGNLVLGRFLRKIARESMFMHQVMVVISLGINLFFLICVGQFYFMLYQKKCENRRLYDPSNEGTSTSGEPTMTSRL